MPFLYFHFFSSVHNKKDLKLKAEKNIIKKNLLLIYKLNRLHLFFSKKYLNIVKNTN